MSAPETRQSSPATPSPEKPRQRTAGIETQTPKTNHPVWTRFHRAPCSRCKRLTARVRNDAVVCTSCRKQIDDLQQQRLRIRRTVAKYGRF